MLRILTFKAISDILGTMGVANAMVTSANDSDDESNRDPLNKTCHKSGFNYGVQSKPHKQTTYGQRGVNDNACYEGFISGYIKYRVRNIWRIISYQSNPLEKIKHLHSALKLFLFFKSILG